MGVAVFLSQLSKGTRVGNVVDTSIANPDPPDPHFFGPPGSGSISLRYGSGPFYHHAKIVRKSLIPTFL
jgi:hypothetical protein